MNTKISRKKNKNLSYFSHEYIIQNHGDIVSFVAMIIVMGLMFKITTPLASRFVVMGHNVTMNETSTKTNNFYIPGKNDLLCCVFYTLICIVIHAVIQEYGLDKLNKKLHLSKTKYSKFNESGQLAIFYLISAVWGANIIYSEKYLNSLSGLWENYPHIPLPFWVKFYYIIQICYWLHGFPELYFQKIKKEEIPQRILYTTLHLVAVTIPYILNMTRFGMVLLVVNYGVEFVFHLSRLIHFSGKTKYATFGFYIWDLLFVITRISCTALAFLIFQIGLEKYSRSTISFSEGNFNTKIVRLNCLIFVFMTQLYMMWNFLNFHIKQWRERSYNKKGLNMYNFKRKDKKKNKKEDDEINELPEADQNQQKELRQRKIKK